MKITIKEILDETEFTLGIWNVRLGVCRGIMNNFNDRLIQDIIDFKGERDTSDYDLQYTKMVQQVWENYCIQDFDSGHWGDENRGFTSNFIIELAKRRKEDVVNAKKKKVTELKEQIIELEEELRIQKGGDMKK